MEIKRFTIGSRAIFSGYKDFENYTTDNDILIIEDASLDYDIQTSVKDMQNEEIHYIKWKNLTKEELLDYHDHCRMGTFIQKFLVPEYSEYYGITIDDLKRLGRLIDYLDDKHSYEKLVYEAYIENGGFYMTPEQKEIAYEEYKRKRVEGYVVKEANQL